MTGQALPDRAGAQPGRFRKTGGGPTNIVNIDFVNRGVRSEAGIIAPNSPLKTFHDRNVLEAFGGGKIELRKRGAGRRAGTGRGLRRRAPAPRNCASNSPSFTN